MKIRVLRVRLERILPVVSVFVAMVLTACGIQGVSTDSSVLDTTISDRISRTTPVIVRLTKTETDEENPVWSPDGTRLAFESSRDGNKEIYTMDADGNHTRDLTQNPANDDDPIWSPDSKQLLFVSNRDGNKEIYVMDSDGASQRNLSRNAANDRWPVWSYDGLQVMFI